MSLRQEQLPAPTGVAANADVLFHIPGGRAVHTVWIQLAEATNAITLASGLLMGDVQCIINQKTVRQVTGVQLNHINACNEASCAVKTTGILGNAGYQTLLPIHFAEPWRKLPLEVHGSAWHLNGVASDGMDIKVRLGNLTTPVIGGWYEWEPSTQNMGLIVKYLRKTYGAVGATLEDTKVDVGDLYQAMHFFPTTDGKFVQSLDVKAGNDYNRKEITYLQNQAVLLDRGLNPDVGLLPTYDCIFDYDDPVDQWLRTNTLPSLSFKATLNAAAAGNLDVVSVRVGVP